MSRPNTTTTTTTAALNRRHGRVDEDDEDVSSSGEELFSSGGRGSLIHGHDQRSKQQMNQTTVTRSTNNTRTIAARPHPGGGVTRPPMTTAAAADIRPRSTTTTSGPLKSRTPTTTARSAYQSLRVQPPHDNETSGPENEEPQRIYSPQQQNKKKQPNQSSHRPSPAHSSRRPDSHRSPHGATVSAEVARLPVSVTGEIVNSSSESDVEERAEAKSDESKRGDSHRHPRPHVPSSPSLSSLMRGASADNADPTKSPYGRHHHAGIYELTTSSQPKLVEFTKIGRDGLTIEHHVSTEKQYGSSHERTLAEMEHIMRANDEFPEPGKIGQSGFPTDPKLSRQLIQRTTGDELLDNPLGDELIPVKNVLDDLPDPAHAKYDRDPFINEKELEYYQPKSVFPSMKEKAKQARLGSDSPVLESKSLDPSAATLNHTRRKRSDSLTELDSYAVHLATSTKHPDAPLLPPRTPDFTPRDHLQPPPTPPSITKNQQRPITPPDYQVGVKNVERQASSVEPTTAVRKEFRDLFDVSPRLDALGPNKPSKLAPQLQLAQTIPIDINAPLPTLTETKGVDVSKKTVPGKLSARSAFPSDALASDHHQRHGLPSSKHAPNGGVFGSVSHASSNHHFDAHHTSLCALCSERDSVYYCYDCGLSLCAGPVGRKSGLGDDREFNTASTNNTSLESGCHEAIHQEFTGHKFVKISEKTRSDIQEKARKEKLKHIKKENAKLVKGDYQADLLLVEPADPLELQPPPPPSPPRFYMLDDYLKADSTLEKDTQQDLLNLKGICAICQSAKGTIWCEDCGLVLCRNEQQKVLDATTNNGLDANLVNVEDSSNPDCDHTLHVGEHANHIRVPYDPQTHKPTYKIRSYSSAVELARDHGYRAGDPLSPPPSLPPSNLPSPRFVPTKSSFQAHLKSNLPPGSFNYKTGSYGPTCDICSEKEAVLYCQECEYYLCIANGCDHDVHAFQNSVESKVHGQHITSHHRIPLKENAKQGLMISPIPTPRLTPSNSPRKSSRIDSMESARSYAQSTSGLASGRISSRRPTTPHIHTYSKNGWCSRCCKNRATVACLSCEMNFCTGKNGRDENCDQIWHESESSFKRHKRTKIDPSLIDPNLPPRFQATKSPARTPRLSEEEKEANKYASLEKRAANELASARRQAEEAHLRESETKELERRALERKLSESGLNESDDDDVDAFFKARREQARKANEMDGGPTPRTKTKSLGANGFDPDSIQPVPECSECHQNRSDVYCFECKKFYCADAHHRPPISADTHTSPESTSTHNNCFFHIHQLPTNTGHRSFELAHYEAEKERIRLAKYAERERESAARRQEAAELARQAEESKRRMKEQMDAKMRAAEEKRLAKIKAKQDRLKEKEKQYEAWKLQQQDESLKEKERIREENERERKYWLDAARVKILALDAERDRGEKELQAEVEAIRARHRAVIAARQSKLHEAESKHWLAHREEIRRKRAIRAENLNAQREWLERRQKADAVWRDTVARNIMAQAKEARKLALEQAQANKLLDTELGRTAVGIGHKVETLLDATVDSKTQTSGELTKVSTQLRQRRQDLVEIARENRRLMKERERAAIEEGLATAIERRRINRQKKSEQDLKQIKEEHKEKLEELTKTTTIEERRVKDAVKQTAKAADKIKAISAEKIASIHAQIDAERTKLMTLRARKHARMMAAKKRATESHIKQMGQIKEGSEGMSESTDMTNRTITTATTVSEQQPRSRKKKLFRERSPISSRTGTSFTGTGTSRSTATSATSATASSFTTQSSQSTSPTKSSTLPPSSVRSSNEVSESSFTGTDTNSILTGMSQISSRAGTTDTSLSLTDDSYTATEPSYYSEDDTIFTENSSFLPEQDQDSQMGWHESGDQSMSLDTFLDTEPNSPQDSRTNTTGRPHSRSSSHSRSRSGSRSSGTGSSSYYSSESESDVSADDLSMTNSARARQPVLKKAPRARDLVRQRRGQTKMDHKFTLDQLQEREMKGDLYGPTNETREPTPQSPSTYRSGGESSSTVQVTQPTVRVVRRIPGEPLPKDPASQLDRARRRSKVKKQADPDEVWAMRVGESERGSMIDEDDQVSQAPSALTFHSNYSDVSVPTPRSNAASDLTGFESYRLSDHYRDEVDENEEAGIIRNTSADRRALRHATKQANHAFTDVRTNPHQLASQLLSLLDSAPNISAPLKTVFRMLIAKWLDQSHLHSNSSHETDILTQAFHALTEKIMDSTNSNDHPEDQTRRLSELQQIWAELLRSRAYGGIMPNEDGFLGGEEFELGYKRGESEPNPLDGEFDGNYSARRDGVTDLLVKPNQLVGGATRPRVSDDNVSVMGGTRSVTGEVDRDRDLQQPLTALQIRHLEEQRRMVTVESQRADVQRKAARVLKDNPYSDFEQSFESIAEEEDRKEGVRFGESGNEAYEFHPTASNSFLKVDGDESQLSTGRRQSVDGDDLNSLASFELGLNPRDREMENLRARRLAQQGEEPVSEVGSIKSSQSIVNEPLDNNSSSSSSDDDYDDDSILNARPPGFSHRTDSDRRPISLPSLNSGFNEDRWYVDFHRRALKKQEQDAFAAQDQYDANRNATIEQIRERDEPLPFNTSAPMINPYITPQQQVAPNQQSRSSFSSASFPHANSTVPIRTSSASSSYLYDDFQPGLPSSITNTRSSTIRQSPPTRVEPRMIRTLDGEVGGLQVASGLAAQAEPSKFLPHEWRQHEKRLGIQPVDLNFHPTNSFDQKLLQQMEQTQEWNEQHHLKRTTPTIRSGTSVRTQPSGIYGDVHVRIPRAISSSSHSTTHPTRRLGQSLVASHFSHGLEYPPPRTGLNDPSLTQTLPAASNIALELAYLQQLRRREISHPIPSSTK